jgi:hypothetical protein
MELFDWLVGWLVGWLVSKLVSELPIIKLYFTVTYTTKTKIIGITKCEE